MRACVCVCVRACVRVCVCVSARTCASACVRERARVRVRACSCGVCLHTGIRVVGIGVERRSTMAGNTRQESMRRKQAPSVCGRRRREGWRAISCSRQP